MVSLSDIPCVGKVVDRISDATVDAFFRGLRYLFCYKELIDVLNSEIENVNIQEYRVSQKCAEERANGKIIEDHVFKWQTEGGYAQGYEIIKFGKDLLANEIAHLPVIENLPTTDAAFQDFSSRKNAYGKLWNALTTEGSPLILGIYRMPGVGKTRMTEQIWKEAMEKKIFNKVMRANVGSEKLDVFKLQNQIAGYLNCHFESQDNVESRASQLKNSLIYGGKILIILDDVWSEIPLDDVIGASFGEGSSSKGSKILLTSRREDICLRNNCKSPVQITALTVKEAWDLFQNSVGTCHINSLQDETLAKEVCTKCAGLPLLICAVGRALQFMSHYVWKDVLQKLRKGNFKNIAGIDPQIYACVRLSIDTLHDDAKLCLFFCSLFPEDAHIDIRKLIQVSIGSQLVPDGESTIPAMVDILTKSSLLLNCRENHITKLHDIIRDVSRSIAFADPKYAFLHVRCSSRLPDNFGNGTNKLLRLDVEDGEVYFPEDLTCTDLHTLWLHCNNHLQQFSEHFSLQPLSKLKMLIFDNCDIRETDVSLFPKNLNTLCIWGCNLRSPLDLPNLEYLRKLDIQQELPEVKMVPSAISSLSSLEELHIRNGFRFSDDAKDITPIMDEISRLTRLTSLKIFLSDFEACQGTSIFFKLKKYDISVGQRLNTQALPVSTRMIELIDVEVKRDKGFQSLLRRAEKMTLKSTDVDVSIICNSNREAFADLRELEIESCDAMEYIARLFQDEILHSWQPLTSFSKLTILRVGRCSAMKYLFCKSVAKYLMQLQTLYIHECPAMEVIVTNEGTGDGEIIEFSKLKKLELGNLGSLRSFYREKKEKNWGSTDKSVISYVQFQPLFDEMVAFPSLEVLCIYDLEHTVTDIWGKHYYDDNNNNNIASSSSFCKLKRLEVSGCSKLESVIPHAMLHRLRNLERLDISFCSSLRNVFPPCIARDLIHLQHMEIRKCDMMRELIREGEQKQKEITHDDDGTIIVFPKMTKLKLVDLENLTSFWCYQGGESDTYKVKFPTLEDFYLRSCGEIKLEAIELWGDDSTSPLKILNMHSVNQLQLPCFRSLQQLQRLVIINCALLEEIVEDVKGDEHAEMDTQTIFGLEQLKSVFFSCLPNLKSFIHGSNYECYMPSLKEVEVRNCGLLSLFRGSISRNLQQLETLVVFNCRLLEGIVEDGRGEAINFCKLKILWLMHLSSLKSFYREKKEMHLGSLNNSGISCVQFQPLFDGMVAFPSLKYLEIKDLEITDIWGNHNYDDYKNNFVASSFCKLYMLEVNHCRKLESVIPHAMLHRLRNLERLDVSYCRGLRNAFPSCIARDLTHLRQLRFIRCTMMREIIRGSEREEEEEEIIVFPELKELELVDLKILTCFWCCLSGKSSTFTYKELEVKSSGRSALFTVSGFRSLLQLQTLKISECALLEEIVEDVTGDEHAGMDTKTIELFQLDSIIFKDLPNLRIFAHGANYQYYMPALKKVEVDNCGLPSLFTSPVFRNLHLETLVISNCRLLEGIINDGRGDETSDTDDKIFILCQLSSVTLNDLPNLRSFSCSIEYFVKATDVILSSSKNCMVIRLSREKDLLVAGLISSHGVTFQAWENCICLYAYRVTVMNS
ncbi:hypothetical protein AgCh_039487 [Apium graveolens]